MKDDKTMIGRQVRFVFVVLLYLIAGSAIYVPLLFCAGFMLLPGFSTEPNHRVVTDPGGDFTHYTGLAWPASASVVSSGDTSIDFLGDDEFYLVFDVDHTTLEKWLSKSPPWNHNKWKRGPVPGDIGWHCSFGSSGLGFSSVDAGSNKYTEDPQVVNLLSSKEIWYVVKERCCESLHWHNGDVLIIDLKQNRVWLSSWDF